MLDCGPGTVPMSNRFLAEDFRKLMDSLDRIAKAGEENQPEAEETPAEPAATEEPAAKTKVSALIS
mgnify:CR=1 FL=1